MRNYNKLFKYRKHHGLSMEAFELSQVGGHFIIGAILATIILLFDITYYPAIKASDFVLFVMLGFYQFFLRSKIYRGKITAYYRRNYKKVGRIVGNYSFFGLVFVWKFVTISFYRFVKTRDISAVFKDIYHPITTPLTILITLLVFYLTYYQDKYTTIREYSNKVNYKIKELNKSEEEAIREFYKEKDKEYGIKEFRGMYYDYDEEIEKKEKIQEDKKENEEKDSTIIRREPRQRL